MGSLRHRCRPLLSYPSSSLWLLLLIAVMAPAVANAADAFSASAVAAVAAVAAAAAAAAAAIAAAAVVIAVAIAVAAATTIAVTAAVVDCYVSVTPPLDFDGPCRRRCHSCPYQSAPSIGTGTGSPEVAVEAMTGGAHGFHATSL